MPEPHRIEPHPTGPLGTEDPTAASAGGITTPSGTERVRAFLPTKDFEISKAFYRALGFTLILDSDVAILSIGANEIILTRYYQKEYAENSMMQLFVDDLDAWWVHLSSLELPERFDVPVPKEPALQPWGLRVAYVVDPCGVLWHVAERPEDGRTA